MFTTKSNRASMVRGVAGAVCLAGGLLLAIRPAFAQFNTSVGGVGQDVIPGKLRGVGTLRAIGGFNRVYDNPVLRNSANTGRPVLPTDASNAGYARRGGIGTQGRSLYGGGSSLDAISMRYATSAKLETSMRRQNDYAGYLARVRADLWEGRGLSVIGQSFMGGDVAFEPTATTANLGRLRRQAARFSYTDWRGRTTQMRSFGPLRNAVWAKGLFNQRTAQPSRFQPVGNAVYQAGEVAVSSGAARRSDGEPAVPNGPPTKSLQEVITDRLQQDLDSKLAKGWDLFRTGLYSEAYNTFALADAIRPNTPEAKLGIVYSGIVISRYNAAQNALVSMVRHNADLAGRLVNPEVLYAENPQDVRKLDLDARYKAFENYAASSPGESLRALQTFIEWGRANRTEAQAIADRLAEGQPADSFAARLSNLMRQASAQPRG